MIRTLRGVPVQRPCHPAKKRQWRSDRKSRIWFWILLRKCSEPAQVSLSSNIRKLTTRWARRCSTLSWGCSITPSHAPRTSSGKSGDTDTKTSQGLFHQRKQSPPQSWFGVSASMIQVQIQAHHSILQAPWIAAVDWELKSFLTPPKLVTVLS